MSADKHIQIWLGDDTYAQHIGDISRVDFNEFPDEFAALLNADSRFQIDWSMALLVLEYESPENPDAEGEGESPASQLLAQIGHDGWAQLKHWLSTVQLPPKVPAQLRVQANGITGRTGFSIKAEWEGQAAKRIAQLEPKGAFLWDGPVPCYRMSYGQYRLSETLENIVCGSGNRDDDVLAIGQVKECVPVDDTSVAFDTFLNRQEVRVIDGVAPRLVPVQGGMYQARPRVKGIADADVEKYFYRKWKSGSNVPFSGRTSTGQRERRLITEQAHKGFERLRDQPLLNPKEAAQALSDPYAFFGPDLILSDRVTGLGPDIRSVVPIRQFSEVGDWLEWSGDYKLSSASDSATDILGELELSDPVKFAEIKKGIEAARESGSHFIPHPSMPGVMLTIDAQLLKLVERHDPDIEKSQPATSLLVKDNLEELNYRGQIGDTDKTSKHYRRPPDLDPSIELYQYQKEGLMWLESIDTYEPSIRTHSWDGGLLADDMGLGKTLQVLSHLNNLTRRGRCGPHLIVAPVALLENWRMEARKFFGHAFEPTLLVQGMGRNQSMHSQLATIKSHKIVLVSYETLRKQEFLFAAVDWDVIALDEAQKAKNPDTQIARVLLTLKAHFKLCLTGTPVENRLREMWTLFNWAVPGLLDSLATFRDQFVKPLEGAEHSERAALANRLLERIEPVFVRRMKTEVLGDKLPMKRFQPIYVDLSPEQEEAYSRIIAEARDKPRNRLSTLMPLFGVCAHPDLDGTGQPLQTLSQNHFPKGAKLFELLDAIHSRGEKALIFANRMDIQKWLQSECRHRYGLRPDIINGAVTSSTRRLATVDNFSTSVGFNVLILAPRAAGVGLNITAANHVIHYMREWNPAVENQATDRAYRLGQTRDVTVYTIICRSSLGETVEERLDRLLSKKRQLMDDFVIPVGGCEIKANELLDVS